MKYTVESYSQAVQVITEVLNKDFDKRTQRALEYRNQPNVTALGDLPVNELHYDVVDEIADYFYESEDVCGEEGIPFTDEAILAIYDFTLYNDITRQMKHES